MAQKYMEVFFSGGDLEELSHLFANDFRFRGPSYDFDSAEDYINSLRADPPKKFQYKIIGSFEDESSACLVYQFSKPGVSTPMAQMFEVSDGKISKNPTCFRYRGILIASAGAQIPPRPGIRVDKEGMGDRMTSISYFRQRQGPFKGCITQPSGEKEPRLFVF